MKRGNFKFYEGFAYWNPGLGGVAGLLLWLLAGALLGNLVTMAFVKIAGEISMDLLTIVSYPVMFIPPMLYAKIKSMKLGMDVEAVQNPLDRNRFAPIGAWACAAVVVVITLAAGFVADVFSLVLPEMPEQLKKTLEAMTSGNFLYNFISVSLFAPFFEEWLCRGMVLRGMLSNGYKPWVAIVISGFFFAFIHMNLWQAVPAFLLGCLFGYVYYKTGSLKLTMLMHFTNNTFSLLLSRSESLREMESWLDVMSVPAYVGVSVLCVIVLVSGIRALSRIDVMDSENVGSTLQG